MPGEIGPNRQAYDLYKNWDGANYEKIQFTETTEDVDRINQRILHTLYRMLELIPNGRRFIDIGCGPCPLWTVPASSKFKEMCFADFCPGNVARIQSWIENPTADEKDKPVHLQSACAVYEGKSWDELRGRLVKAAMGFYQCDVLRYPVVQDINGTLFDAAMCIWVIACAAKTTEDYTEALKNIGHLLKPGGYLIIADELDASGYKLGASQYKLLQLSSEQMDRCIADAGFKIIETMSHYYDDDEQQKGQAEDRYFWSEGWKVCVLKKL